MVGESQNLNINEVAASADQELNAVFDVLSHHRRRFIIVFLADHTGPIPLTDLATEVAIRQHEAPIEEISNEKLQSIALSLHHAHLPKLADVGAVEYDKDHNLIQQSSTATQFQRILSRVVDGEKAGR